MDLENWRISSDGKFRVHMGGSQKFCIQQYIHGVWEEVNFDPNVITSSENPNQQKHLCVENEKPSGFPLRESTKEDFEDPPNPLIVLQNEFQELVDNEKRFVEGIKKLHDDFSVSYKNDVESVGMTKEVFNTIFGQIDMILAVNKRLLKKLQAVDIYEGNDFCSEILEIFCNNAEFQFYLIYSQNFEESVQTLRNELENKEHPNSKLTGAMKEKGWTFGKIEGVMISPVQRFPRYSLVLQRIQKKIKKMKLYSDVETNAKSANVHSMLATAIEMLHGIYTRMNEKKKEKRQNRQILEIAKYLKKVDPKLPPVASPGRQYLDRFENRSVLHGLWMADEKKSIEKVSLYVFNDAVYIVLKMSYISSFAFDFSKSVARVAIPVDFSIGLQEGGGEANRKVEYRMLVYLQVDVLRIKVFVAKRNSELKISNLWSSMKSWKDVMSIKNVKKSVSSIIEEKRELSEVCEFSIRVQNTLEWKRMKEIFSGLTKSSQEERIQQIQIVCDKEEEEKIMLVTKC